MQGGTVGNRVPATNWRLDLGDLEEQVAGELVPQTVWRDTQLPLRQTYLPYNVSKNMEWLIQAKPQDARWSPRTSECSRLYPRKALRFVRMIGRCQLSQLRRIQQSHISQRQMPRLALMYTVA